MRKVLIIEDDTAIAAIERDYLEIESFEVKISGESGRSRYLFPIRLCGKAPLRDQYVRN